MSIIQIPTSNFWANRNGHKPRWIIVHGTAGGTSPYDIAHQFIGSQGSSNHKSTHYVIGQDGTVVQCVAEKDAAWGNGVPERGCDSWWDNGVNPNLTTISIEHVKNDPTNAIALTDAQKRASFELIKEICDRNGIPKRKADGTGGITGHFSISPVDRARCPGTYPWQDLFNFLQQNGEDMLQITDSFAATYFQQQDANHWYCPNTKQVIADGILDYYRRTQGAARLPLTGENYSIPGVAYQVFEAGVIVWDPQNKLGSPGGLAYMMVLNSPLVQSLFSGKYQDAIKQAQAQAAAAIAQEKAAEDQMVALQKEIDGLKNQPPTVDKAAVSADLTNAATAIQAAKDKLG